jgi:hypothetical protein
MYRELDWAIAGNEARASTEHEMIERMGDSG